MARKRKPWKLSWKIFIYIISILIFNSAMLSVITNFFLTEFSTELKSRDIYEIAQSLALEDEVNDSFLRKVRQVQYENYYITVYDLKDQVIEYSNTGHKKDNISKKETEELYRLSELDKELTKDEKFGNSIYNITGRRGQITALSFNENNGKLVMIQTPRAQIERSTEIVKRFNIISSLIIIIFSILPTMAIVAFITRPIKEYNSVAKAIGEKDFTRRCIIRTNDEIGDLGRGINSMGDKIERYTSDLLDANESLRSDIANRERTVKMQVDFISNISHELKTPISIISAYAEGIKRGLAKNKDDIDDYCDIIIKETENMSSLIIDLINTSRLESQTVSIKHEKFNITEVAQGVIDRFLIACEEKGIKIKLEADDEVQAFADKKSIETVITNYVENAYKNTKDLILVNIRIENNKVRVGVFNNGPQIPDEDKESIWDKFFKVEKSHNRKDSGTGLGLSIVKATMNLHKMPYGFINKEDGVEFYIELMQEGY